MTSFWPLLASTLVMATREIRRNGLRSALTMLGISIGVATVVLLVTLSRGARERVVSEVASKGVNMLTLTPGSERRGGSDVGAAPFSLDDARVIAREIPLVVAAAPTASRSVLAIHAHASVNTSLVGTTNSYFFVRRTQLSQGRAFSEAELASGQPVCVLGATVQKALFGADAALGARIRLGRVSCLVIGTTEEKGQSTFGRDQDDYVLTPIATMQRRFMRAPDVDAIALSTVHESQTDRAKDKIRLLMRERRGIRDRQEDDFMIHDRREVVQTLETVSQVLTALLGAVAATSLLVGGVGIMNIMWVSVAERTREIGIRLAIGARTHEILLQFLLEAMLLCTVGGLLGLAVGIAGSLAIGHVLDLPVRLVPEVALGAVAAATAMGMACGFLPARRAARLDPIEALRTA